jgi:mono/diheme cytochrome c family protein
MSRLRWFLLGVFSLAVVLLIAGGVVFLGARGFSAREGPTALERQLARAARAAALPSGAKTRANPIPNSTETLAEARAHWADHCAICHANDGSGDTLIGKRSYPPAPDMRAPATQNMSDGELFFIIQNGVRLTGMPAWGSGSEEDDQDSWKLVHFIRHLPQLTAEEVKEMEKLNPKSPEELQEELEEQRFLRGDDTDEKPTQQRRHH